LGTDKFDPSDIGNLCLLEAVSGDPTAASLSALGVSRGACGTRGAWITGNAISEKRMPSCCGACLYPPSAARRRLAHRVSLRQRNSVLLTWQLSRILADAGLIAGDRILRLRAARPGFRTRLSCTPEEMSEDCSHEARISNRFEEARPGRGSTEVYRLVQRCDFGRRVLADLKSS